MWLRCLADPVGNALNNTERLNFDLTASLIVPKVKYRI